jgi:hypothetical protein
MPRGKHIKPDIGAKTQFGKPNGMNPKHATKMGVPQWSIRKALAHMESQATEARPAAQTNMVRMKSPRPFAPIQVQSGRNYTTGYH